MEATSNPTSNVYEEDFETEFKDAVKFLKYLEDAPDCWETEIFIKGYLSTVFYENLDNSNSEACRLKIWRTS